MLTPEQKQLLKSFHNSLHDTALSPDDPRYVRVFDPNKEDPIDEISTNISFSEQTSVNLVTGPRGSGKSTELKRLTKILREEKFIVFHCDMSSYINLTTPIDITDFLISVMAALNDAAEQQFGKDFTERSYQERLTDLLTRELNLKDFSVKSHGATIKASLKDDPTFKQRLQESLKGHVSRVVMQAHEFAQDVVKYIRKQANDKTQQVVLIVDSVEQIRGVGSDAELVYKSVENVFSAQSDSLEIPSLHMVYTIPPYMSALAPGVARMLGNNAVHTLPSVHVRTKDNQDDPQGLDIMYQILQKRCEQLDSILTKEQINTLAKLSGGDLRNYFRFVRTAIIKAASTASASNNPKPLPIEQRLIDNTINQFRREMLIPHNDLKWLRLIDQDSDHNLNDKEALAQFASFLDSGLILNYRNGEDWYGVNPLLRDLLDSKHQKESDES